MPYRDYNLRCYRKQRERLSRLAREEKKHKKMLDGALFLRQRQFCDEYILCGNVPEAAAKVGYKKGSTVPYKILKSENGERYIKERRAQLDKTVEVNFGWKVKKLSTIVEASVGDTPETVDKRHAGNAISAISELNKMQGHHAPTAQVVVNLEQDEYIKKINDVTMRILEEKRNAIEYAKKDGRIYEENQLQPVHGQRDGEQE